VRFGLISLRCQTVPSPFGSGSSDSEVVPCILHSLLVRATSVARTAEEGRKVELEPEPAQLSQTTSVTIECWYSPSPCQAWGKPEPGPPYLLSLSDAQPASLVSRTLCVFPRTITKIVPEIPYSRL